LPTFVIEKHEKDNEANQGVLVVFHVAQPFLFLIALPSTALKGVKIIYYEK
jgi:hypothetical protein